MEEIAIRPPRAEEHAALYAFAKTIPELRVSARFEFMDPEEFRQATMDPRGVFLCAAAGDHPVGFVYANADDPEKRGGPKKWACLVYLAVDPAIRRRGIATRLYEACIGRLKEMGVTHVYGWANDESDGAVIAFMKRRGFAEGHRYVWMDKAL